MDTLDDPELVAQAKSDSEAFSALYRRYVQRIYNYHYRHTGNVADAEDLTSQTFYRALRGIDTYHEKGATFQAWLFRIAHNLVVNWYRDHGRRQVISLDEMEDSLPLERASPQVNLEMLEEQQRVLAILRELPEDRKTLLLLKFVEKMSNADIAVVLNKTEGAIKALYNRTLSSLRQMLVE